MPRAPSDVATANVAIRNRWDAASPRGRAAFVAAIAAIFLVIVIGFAVSGGGKASGGTNLVNAVDASTLQKSLLNVYCGIESSCNQTAECLSGHDNNQNPIPAGDYECAVDIEADLPPGQVYLVKYDAGAGPCPDQSPTPWSASSESPLGDASDQLTGCA